MYKEKGLDNNMKKYIIAGVGGIGKTTLNEINPKDVIDMEIRPYKYANYKSEYTLEQWYNMEHIFNKEGWIEKYFEAIKKEIEEGTHKIILVWPNQRVLNWMTKENIDYSVSYFDMNQEGMIEFLTNLYVKRGNPQDWIDECIRYMYVIDKYAKENNIDSIILKKNENIEMKLKELNL